MKPVSIVIPNFNGRDLLRANLPSVLAAVARHPGLVEVCVVDDGSTDDSRALLARRFPDLAVVALPRNRGFQKAATAGIEAAAHDHVLLLNTDVRVRDDFIAPLLRHFDRPDVFAVGSLALKPDEACLDQNVQIPFLKRGTFRFRKIRGARLEVVQGKWTEAVESLYVVGGHCLLDRAKHRQLGGFDPIYEPFYYEEIDLCYRAWKRGFTTWVEPTSLVVHEHRGTIGRFYGARHGGLVNERNRLLFTWKNLTSRSMFRQHWIHLGIKILYKWMLLDGSFYRALFQATRRLRPALAGRRREAAEQVLCDEAVFDRLAEAERRLRGALGEAAAIR